MDKEPILTQTQVTSATGVQGYVEPSLHEPLRPNFTKAELQQTVLPKRIAKEIRWEKYWIFFMFFIGLILSLTGIFFLLVWFVPEPQFDAVNQITTKWLIDVNYIPQPWLMFIFLGVGIVLLILSAIEYAHIIASVNRYKGDILMKSQSIPYFLVKSYRAIVARVVYLNWLAGVVYVTSAISIGVMFAISAITPEMPLTTEKNITYILLGITLGFQLVSLLIIKYRKGNLNSFYGKDLVNLEEQKQIRKTANRRCLFTFVIVLSVVLLFIVIPWMIVRKKKGLKPIPFL